MFFSYIFSGNQIKNIVSKVSTFAIVISHSCWLLFVKRMYMSKCMYMSECKIFHFFTFRYPNTTPTVYNWSETTYVVRYDLFPSAVFLPYFSMLIFSLPPLRLGSRSTSLSHGFCVRRPRQYSTICWKLNLISGFFVFFWLFVWTDGINKCGWCLAGGRGC